MVESVEEDGCWHCEWDSISKDRATEFPWREWFSLFLSTTPI